MLKTITPQQLADLRNSGRPLHLIDVRTPAEFREVHVDCARNVPLDRLDVKAIVSEFNREGEGPLYVICRSGSRGKQACERFFAAGFENVFNVDGGTSACELAGLPIVRGKKAISLERQVRIVAGLMVVIGAGLSFVNPLWALLAAFVGAGLVFAGVTDTCGMAILLGRMPWNQVASGPAPTCSTNGSCGVK